MQFRSLTILVLGLLLAACHTLQPDDPQRAAKTTTLGKIIVRSQGPVHVMFVHGMRATGPKNADALVGALEDFLKREFKTPVAVSYVPQEPMDVGSWPRNYVDGRQVWRSDEEWHRSRPFVGRYTLTVGDKIVVVDDVNWWPLLFPVKCRLLVLQEILLAGPDRKALDLCASGMEGHGPWLTAAEISAAKEHRHSGSGGALINASIKQSILDWGLADAVVAVGPLRTAIRKGLNVAFARAADMTVEVPSAPGSNTRSLQTFSADQQNFVVVSESLGSFVVLDAFENSAGDSPDAQRVGRQTGYLYFFANQFALLELGRSAATDTRSQADSLPLETTQSQTPQSLLRHWADAKRGVRPRGEPGGVIPDALVPELSQVVAFSDPSDLLTFDVPPLCETPGCESPLVVNFHVRNATRWFGLLANPVKAHTGHTSNPAVLGELFRTQ